MRVLETNVKRFSEVVDVFVSCFCEQGDLLSQWRGYGAGTSGVSIGFKAKELRSRSQLAQADYSIQAALYDTETIRNIVMLRYLQAVAKITTDHLGEWDVSVDQMIEYIRSSDAMRDFMAGTAVNAIRMKHEGFHEECEWRAVVSLPSSGNAQLVDFRSGPLTLTPYVEIDVTDPVRHLPLVGEIICGQTTYEDETLFAVEMYLEKMGFKKGEVPVRMSSTPFR
jgi:hypothetical protein